MLVALEGVKLRAVYEPHLACEEEQRTIVDGLMRIVAPESRSGPKPNASDKHPHNLLRNCGTRLHKLLKNQVQP